MDAFAFALGVLPLASTSWDLFKTVVVTPATSWLGDPVGLKSPVHHPDEP